MKLVVHEWRLFGINGLTYEWRISEERFTSHRESYLHVHKLKNKRDFKTRREAIRQLKAVYPLARQLNKETFVINEENNGN